MIEKIQKSLKDALKVAKMIKLQQSGIINKSPLPDFGIHIEGASSLNCGTVTIDNLSSSDISIKIKVINETNLKPQLTSDTVKGRQKIEVSFQITGNVPTLPFIAQTICEITAYGIQKSKTKDKCQIRAYVRRVPNYSIIESSESLIYLNDISCTLAPKNYTEAVNLKHRIPPVSLSQKSFGWSLISQSTNVAYEPQIQMDNKKCKMQLTFESETKGLCAGQMIVGLGSSELYRLNLSVPISQIPSIGMYHPADKKSQEIRLIKSNYTHIVVYNNGDQEQDVRLNSSELRDRFNPESLLIQPHTQGLVKVQLSSSPKRTISFKRSRVTIQLEDTQLRFSEQGDKIRVDIEEGVYFPCININSDGTTKFEYMKSTKIMKEVCPTIITDNDQQENSQQGLISIEANLPIPQESLVLWAENGENCEYIRIIGQQLDKDILNAVDKIDEANNLTGTRTAGIPKLFFDATNFFLKSNNQLVNIDKNSVVECAKKGVKENDFKSIFSQIILALYNEVQRVQDNKVNDTISQICCQVTKREEWSMSSPEIPTTWTRQDKGSKILGMHLIWGAITLLNTLCNPLKLTKREIDMFRDKLSHGPPIPINIPIQKDNKNEQINQKIDGQEVHCIGVIDGKFTEVKAIDKILQKIQQLKQPEFPQFRQEKDDSKQAKNPSDLNQCLIQIPSKSQQILEEQIFKASEWCQKTWESLIILGIIPPSETRKAYKVGDVPQNIVENNDNGIFINAKSQIQNADDDIPEQSSLSQNKQIQIQANQKMDINTNSQFTSDLSNDDMIAAVRRAVIEKPVQEEQDPGHDYIPMKVNLDQIRQKLIKIDKEDLLV
ncbi:MAG: hypothetical protein EZS28_029102, partial [Streblomastix strix]